MNGLRSAIGFLTILPLAPSGAPDSLASARGWFPLVGLLIGAVLAAIDVLIMLMVGAGFPSLARDAATYYNFPISTILLWSILLVITLVALTRALHLDGFMDSCDALLGGFDRERRLAILRDPNVGAFAVVGVVCLLLVKVAAIAGLPTAGADRLPLLLLLPCLSRWAMLLTMELYPYARRNGLGAAFFHTDERRFRWQLTLGFVFTLAMSVALAGAAGVALLAAACAVAWAIGAWATRLLGGVTGDIYGAVNEVAEAVLLLLALLLISASSFDIRSPLLDTLWFSLR